MMLPHREFNEEFNYLSIGSPGPTDQVTKNKEKEEERADRGEGEGVDTPTPPLLDPRLSKSLSPSSRKQQSAYSSYIRSEICSHTMS